MESDKEKDLMEEKLAKMTTEKAPVANGGGSGASGIGGSSQQNAIASALSGNRIHSRVLDELMTPVQRDRSGGTGLETSDADEPGAGAAAAAAVLTAIDEDEEDDEEAPVPRDFEYETEDEEGEEGDE